MKKIPACAASMGCLCAGHARGNPASAPCDTSELPSRPAWRVQPDPAKPANGLIVVDKDGRTIVKLAFPPSIGAYERGLVYTILVAGIVGGF